MTLAVNEARKEIQILAKQARALIALDEMLADAGSLDTVISQRETQIRDLERRGRELSVENGDLEAKKGALRAGMVDEAKRQQVLIADTKREAEAIRTKARDDALIVIQDANRRSDRIMHDAEAVKKNVEVKVAELDNRKKQLYADIAEAEKRRDDLNSELTRVRRLLTGIDTMPSN